jgi:hypothetical protein
MLQKKILSHAQHIGITKNSEKKFTEEASKK